MEYNWERQPLRHPKDYPWAVEIVQKHFSRGLTALCDEGFLSRRYKEFLLKDDPIYAELLKGMEDEALSKTFVSYWTIAHTMATQSRFWLENAVAEIIIHQTKEFGRQATHVYSQSMLSQGYLERRVTVADIGETELEHLSDRKPWRTTIQRSVLETIDVIVGEQEREDPPRRTPFERLQRKKEQIQGEAIRDQNILKRVADSFTMPPSSQVTMQCNLLVVEPEGVRSDGKVHAWGIRFVNPKTISSHAVRKQERVNLLRLYGLLVQEKILRDPTCISVCAAELLPRCDTFGAADRYPNYFSTATYWSSDQLWKFIDVPFGVVTLAIEKVAKEFRIQLIDGLRGLLPQAEQDEDRRLQGGLFRAD